MKQPNAPDDEDLLDISKDKEFNGQSSYLYRIHKISEARDLAFGEGDLMKYYRNTLSLLSNIEFRCVEKNIKLEDIKKNLLALVNRIITNEKENYSKPTILTHNRRLYELALLEYNSFINLTMNEVGLIFPKKTITTIEQAREKDYEQ